MAGLSYNELLEKYNQAEAKIEKLEAEIAKLKGGTTPKKRETFKGEDGTEVSRKEVEDAIANAEIPDEAVAMVEKGIDFLDKIDDSTLDKLKGLKEKFGRFAEDR